MKKIIALAVASAFIAPAVMADATIYGLIRTHIEYSKISDNGAQDLTRTRLVDDTSRIGFKGTDKLDNGMQLFWQVENRVRVGESNASTGFNTRDTFIGTKGKFGEVSVGQISDLTDSFVGDVVTGLDYWNGSSSSAYIFTTHGDTARLPNSAQYASPVVLGGLQAKAMYNFGAKNTSANYQGYQGQVAYTAKMFKVGAVYKQNDDTANNGDGSVTMGAENYYKSFILGATLTPVNGLDLSVMWDRKKTRTSGVDAQQDAWAAGATYLTGKHGFGLQYAKMGNNKLNSVTVNDTGAYAVVAQYKYSLSKQTTAIATISRLRNDSAASFNLQGVAAGTVNAGAKVTNITAGLRTDF